MYHIETKVNRINPELLVLAREVNIRNMKVDNVRDAHLQSGYAGKYDVLLNGEWITSDELEERRHEGVNYPAYINHARELALDSARFYAADRYDFENE